MQDMGVSAASNREYLIRRFLRPAWGSVMLSAMTTEAITRWENGLPARAGVSRRTAGDARSNPKAPSLTEDEACLELLTWAYTWWAILGSNQ